MANTSKHVKRADGNYCRSVVIGRKPDGRYIRKYFYAKTLRELDEQVAEYERKMRIGTLSDNENARFGETAAAWIGAYDPTVGEKTRHRYEYIIGHQLLPLCNEKVKDLKPFHLQKIIAELAENGYSKSTISLVKQTASAVMEFAMANDIAFRNVFAKTSVPDIDAEERQPIPQTTRSLIMSTWSGHRMGVPALIMLFCGLRRGELIALTWNDVDLKNKKIRISKAAAYNGNQGRVKSPKSKKGNRTVPIPDALIPALLSVRNIDSLMVCPSVRTKGMMSDTAFRRAWDSYMHYLNLQAGGRNRSRANPKVIACEPFTAHQLRHTYATMLYDSSVDILTAKKLLGHADVETTMKIYTHLSQAKEENSIQALNNLINENGMLLGAQ